jgi:hypothetical protein
LRRGHPTHIGAGPSRGFELEEGMKKRGLIRRAAVLALAAALALPALGAALPFGPAPARETSFFELFTSWVETVWKATFANIGPELDPNGQPGTNGADDPSGAAPTTDEGPSLDPDG